MQYTRFHFEKTIHRFYECLSKMKWCMCVYRILYMICNELVSVIACVLAFWFKQGFQDFGFESRRNFFFFSFIRIILWDKFCSYRFLINFEENSYYHFIKLMSQCIVDQFWKSCSPFFLDTIMSSVSIAFKPLVRPLN